jgi:putative ABC transport system permease protein
VSSVLADILGVHEGQNVEVEVLEGRRQRFLLPVASRIDDTLGLQAYVNEDSLRRKLSSPKLATLVALRTDESQMPELIQKIDGFPKVLGVSSKKQTRETLRKNLADSFLTMQVVLMAFAVTLAVGVVYNNARMALSQRSRDLATLRILGFRRKDISLLLFGEQALVWLVGIPLGLPLGKALGRGLLSLTAAEVFRMPVVVSQRTWGLAMGVVAISGLLSTALVIRRAHRLNLLAVLKARD